MNCLSCSGNRLFMAITTSIYLISSYFSWGIMSSTRYSIIVPTISYIAQHLESILNAVAMLILLWFEFGADRRKVAETLQKMETADKQLIDIGVNINNYASEKFLFIANAINISLTLAMLILYSIVQMYAFGFYALFLILHNMLPTLLSTSLMLLYGYILHSLIRRFSIINCALSTLLNMKKPCIEKNNYYFRYNKRKGKTSRSSNRVHQLLLVHCDLCDLMESSNKAFSLTLLVFTIYLSIYIIFRLFIGFQILWDVLTGYDKGPLFLGLITLGRQILVHPFIAILIYLSEHVKKSVSVMFRYLLYKIFLL